MARIHSGSSIGSLEILSYTLIDVLQSKKELTRSLVHCRLSTYHISPLGISKICIELSCVPLVFLFVAAVSFAH
jgi:hypothetical protein